MQDAGDSDGCSVRQRSTLAAFFAAAEPNVNDQPDPEDIKKTWIDSTRNQRAYWTHLMLEEKRETNDQTLNLSSWIIRRLPDPDADPAWQT